MTDINNNLSASAVINHKQEQTRLCTIMAFLIGVEWERCEFYYKNDKELFESMVENTDCVIIRALCRIRTNLMLNYSETYNDMVYNLQNLDKQEKYKDDIQILSNNGLNIIKANYFVNAYIADINKIISERINSIRDLFPEWLRWDYVRALFLMPQGQIEEKIIKESKKFQKNKSCYPYTRYINWNPVDEGNILLNDKKFTKVLYSQNNDVFRDYTKVKDASESVKANIYDFIDNSKSLQLVVDCENSDAFKLASVLKQLDADEIAKIDKIVLYDDVHTTNAWGYLDVVTGIPVDHKIIERIKSNKSLVDIKMGMGISEAYYDKKITSFILLSSDSDFWGVISSLPNADFLVMVEREKCGIDIQNALENDGTYYCFIDDFCTGNIKEFKNAMVSAALKDEINNILNLDSHKLLDDILCNLRMDVSPVERNNYYNRFIQKLKLVTDKNGMMKIKLVD